MVAQPVKQRHVGHAVVVNGKSGGVCLSAGGEAQTVARREGLATDRRIQHVA